MNPVFLNSYPVHQDTTYFTSKPILSQLHLANAKCSNEKEKKILLPDSGRDFSLLFHRSIAFIFYHKIFYTLQVIAPFPISDPPSVPSHNLYTPLP